MMEYSTEKKSKKSLIVYLMIILVLLFIWSNSLDNPGQSYSKSQKVLEIGAKVLGRIFGKDHYLTVFFIGHTRKIAHFTEYLVLGIFITAAMKLSGKTKLQHVYNSLSFAVIAAVIDEFIQIYTYRGSSVRDVVIDFSGYVTGTVFTTLTILVILLVKAIKHSEKEY